MHRVQVNVYNYSFHYLSHGTSYLFGEKRSGWVVACWRVAAAVAFVVGVVSIGLFVGPRYICIFLLKCI